MSPANWHNCFRSGAGCLRGVGVRAGATAALGIGRHIFGWHFPFRVAQLRDARERRETKQMNIPNTSVPPNDANTAVWRPEQSQGLLERDPHGNARGLCRRLVFWYKHLNPKQATNDHTLVFAPTCDDLRGDGLSFSQLSIKELSMSPVSTNPNTATPFSVRVEGMAGESCMERVEKAIRATPGVVSALQIAVDHAGLGSSPMTAPPALWVPTVVV
jgi:hypothetical protein